MCPTKWSLFGNSVIVCNNLTYLIYNSHQYRIYLRYTCLYVFISLLLLYACVCDFVCVSF